MVLLLTDNSGGQVIQVIFTNNIRHLCNYVKKFKKIKNQQQKEFKKKKN